MNTVIEQILKEIPVELAPYLSDLPGWEHWDLFTDAVRSLNREALYKSKIHGYAHIERVLIHGAVICMRLNCSPDDIRLILAACAYHDIGRENDLRDDSHGIRSARMITPLVPFRGESLAIIEAAVEGHSVHDIYQDEIIAKYPIGDTKRAHFIAKVLKDADALDRVRVNALDPSYLRFDCSRQSVSHAITLFHYYESMLSGR